MSSFHSSEESEQGGNQGVFKSNTMGRVSGVVAGMMNVLTAGLIPFAPQEVVLDSFTDYLIEALFVLALAGTLVAIAGLYALQRGRYGRTGEAGSLTAFAGHTLLFLAATAPALAGREVFDAVFPLGVLAVLVGLVFLGAATLRARMLLRWCRVLLIAGFPLTMSSTSLPAAQGG